MMWVYAILVLGLILLQYFLSRELFHAIFRFFYRIIRNRQLAIRFLVIVLLPGTIIHELSHFLAATLVGVRTGTINLLPKIQDDGQVIAGETQIAQCDPIRYSVIGVAPFAVGMLAVYSLGKLVLFGADILPSAAGGWWEWMRGLSAGQAAALIVLFWITNSMFSSPKDLEAIAVPLVLAYVIGFVLYFSGTRIPVTARILESIGFGLREMTAYLALIIAVNFLVWLFLFLWDWLLRRFIRRQ